MRREVEPRADFNRYRDSYRDAVQDSLALPGAEAEFFVRAKARHLVDLANELGNPGRLEVLDVGCGIGGTDQFLEGRFATLAGVDIASELVKEAAKRNPWAVYRSYSEMEPIPHEDQSFDLTFAICVLHHVPPADRGRFVAEMVRVTRPGGLVAIFEHNPWNPLTRRSVRNCEFDKGVVLLSRRDTKRLMERQGLGVVRAPYIVFFTRDGRLLRQVERGLASLPAGAQYYVAGRKAF
jgi:SAM-dependent methyltransferase